MLDLNELLAATIIFVGSHFLLSGPPLRGLLVDRLGLKGFRLLYSLLAAVTLVWMVQAYVQAPPVALWPSLTILQWVPLLVMPFAFILLVAGVTTASPTAVGAEAVALAADPAPGMLRITRHPFLWGAALWAISHIIATGELASLIMMGGILVLSLVGMRQIDRKRELQLGAGWGPIRLTTSIIPFQAIAEGRTTMDWAGIGWWRIALGLALYLIFLILHPYIFGVIAVPW